MIVEMPEAHLEGRGLRACAREQANADGMVVGADGTGTADVRGTVETEDGALIYMRGHGRCDLRAGFGAGTILRGSVVFDTSAEHYRWLNTIFAVFRGVVVGDRVTGDALFHDDFEVS